MSPTPPGWYRSPDSEHDERYWDGMGWTERRRSEPASAMLTGGFHPVPPTRKNYALWRVLLLVALMLVLLISGCRALRAEVTVSNDPVGEASGRPDRTGQGASSTGPKYSVNERGQSYGRVPMDRDRLRTADMPELVAVVGNSGREGYARATDLFGTEEDDPRTPEEALRQQENSKSVGIPVFAADGVTVVDSFTLVGYAAGGVELHTLR